jgi:hypothetical protein
MNECIKLHLPQCRNCLWFREDTFNSVCIVEHYRQSLAAENVSYVRNYMKQLDDRMSWHRHYNFNIYFLAALKHYPELLAIYEKLMVLL